MVATAVARLLLLTAPSLVATTVLTDSAFKLDVAKVRKAAHRLLVDGDGTSREGKNTPWLKSVETIDRILHVKFDVPALDLWPTKEEEKSWTCDRQFICGASNFEVCPGMRLNTAQVRPFGGSNDLVVPVPAITPNTAVKPEITFTATEGMKYSLFFVDLFKPNSSSGDHFPHWAVHNIPVGDVSKGKEMDGLWNYVNPGCSSLTPNQYTFMLFEHNDSKSLPVTATNFTTWLTAMELSSTDLVAVNWMNVSGSPVSNVLLARFGIPRDPAICNTFATNGSDMCSGIGAPEIPTTCDYFEMEEDSSAAPISVFGILGITLVSTLAV